MEKVSDQERKDPPSSPHSPSPSSSSSSLSSLSAESPEFDDPEKKKQFIEKRKKHYNEFQTLKQLRSKIEDEDEDE